MLGLGNRAGLRNTLVVLGVVAVSLVAAAALGPVGAGAAAAGPTAAQLLAKTATCTPASTGKYATDEGGSATVSICKSGTAFFWTSDMDIDCDGITTSHCSNATDPSYFNETSFETSTGQFFTSGRDPLLRDPAAQLPVQLPELRHLARQRRRRRLQQQGRLRGLRRRGAGRHHRRGFLFAGRRARHRSRTRRPAAPTARSRSSCSPARCRTRSRTTPPSTRSARPPRAPGPAPAPRPAHRPPQRQPDRRHAHRRDRRLRRQVRGRGRRQQRQRHRGPALHLQRHRPPSSGPSAPTAPCGRSASAWTSPPPAPPTARRSSSTTATAPPPRSGPRTGEHARQPRLRQVPRRHRPSSADGTRLQIWTCSGGSNQKWTLPA